MKVLKSYKRMPLALEQKLRESIKPVQVRKNDIIQKRGVICDHIYFVEKGVVRGFLYQGRRQQTTWFRKENEFIISTKNIFRNPLTDPIVIEALEDCLLWDFPGSLIEEICHEFLLFNRHCSIIMWEDIAKIEVEKRALRTYSPTHIYNYLRQHAPGLLDRVPLKHLASYMGTSVQILRHIQNSEIQLHISTLRRNGQRDR